MGIGQQFKLSEFNMFDYMPNWVEPFLGTPGERAEKLTDQSIRPAMKTDIADWPNRRTDWDRIRAVEVVHERNYQYEGLTVNEIAEKMGKEPLDAFLDLALDEGLEPEFTTPPLDTEPEIENHGKGLLDPYTHISVSDGGAHTRFTTHSVWPVFWLSYWIRDRELMTLEQGHYKMSALPAWITDFKERGTLRVGNWADIIVYDLDKLGFLHDKPIYADDFPGGERRLIQKPTGLLYTIVNGTVTFEGNRLHRRPTGQAPSQLRYGGLAPRIRRHYRQKGRGVSAALFLTVSR